MANCEGNVEQRKDKREPDGYREMGCRPVYRRRRTPSAKRSSAIRDNSEFLNDLSPHDSNSVSSRCKSRRRLRKLIGKLMRENYILMKQLEEIDADPAILTKIRESEQLITKLRQEYRKLPKHENKIYDEYEKLSSLLEQRENEYSQLYSEYDRLTEAMRDTKEKQDVLLSRNKRLEAENSQSIEDIALLKNVVYRLNAELERYQDKLRSQDDKSKSVEVPGIADITLKQEKVSKSWGSVNLHALGPLLNAYQENLTEKCELLTQYEQELADFGGRCKEVVQENDHMHEEVEELKSKCDRYTDEVKVLSKNNMSLKKENAFLLKEVSDQKKLIEDLHSTYERRMQSMMEENESLKNENEANITELARVKEKYDSLAKNFETINNKMESSVPIVVHTAAVDECKKLLDELKHKYDAEREKLSSQIKQAEEARVKNEKELISVTADRNHLKTLTRTLERSLKRAQRTSEHARSLLRSTQTSCQSFKKQLYKTTAYCEELFIEYERVVAEREKLAALLRDSEKENANIDRLGKSITDRVIGLKTQLQIVQQGTKQQVETVEKRIKIQETRVQRMKREYRSKLRRLKKLIKQKEDMIGRLQTDKTGSNNSEYSRRVAAAAEKEPERVSKSRRATRVTFDSRTQSSRDTLHGS